MAIYTKTSLRNIVYGSLPYVCLTLKTNTTVSGQFDETTNCSHEPTLHPYVHTTLARSNYKNNELLSLFQQVSKQHFGVVHGLRSHLVVSLCSIDVPLLVIPVYETINCKDSSIIQQN